MSKATITYRQVGDHLIPNIEIPEEVKEVQTGIWGMRRKNYLLNNHRVLFNIMLANGTIWNHLAEVDKEAEELFCRLINEIAHAEGVTEEFKEQDQMAWIGAMNSIRHRAMEIVNTEIIFA